MALPGNNRARGRSRTTPVPLTLTRRTLLRGFMASAGLVALQGCGGGDGGTATERSEAAAPRPGGNLALAFSSEPETLDPHVSTFPTVKTVAGLVTESLLIADTDYNIHPGLAERWSVGDDGTVDLTLRPGITFTDGTPFDAEAVKANLNRIVDPNTASAVARDFVSYQTYDGTEVVDELSVRIRFTGPFGPILLGLAQPQVGMISPAAIREFGNEVGNHLVGTGPFTFGEWVKQSHILLRKNPDYNRGGDPYEHDGAAYLDEIRFLVAEEPSTRTGLLESGEAQIIQDVPPQDAERLASAGFTVERGFQPGTPLCIHMNTQAEPTRDIELRKAMLRAIDREAIVRTAYFGFTVPEFGPLSHVTFGYDPAVESRYPFDVEQARRLLDDAGWMEGAGGIRVKDGKPARILHYVSNIDELIAPLYQGQMREIGVDVALENREYSVAFEAILSGATQTGADWYGVADPAFTLGCYFHSQNAGVCTMSGYTSDELDGVLNDALATTDEGQRQELYSRAQEFIMDQALVIPVVNPVQIWAAAQDTQGWALEVTPNSALLYDAFRTSDA